MVQRLGAQGLAGRGVTSTAGHELSDGTGRLEGAIIGLLGGEVREGSDHGIQCAWCSYLIQDVEELEQDLETAFADKLLPGLFGIGHEVHDERHFLIALDDHLLFPGIRPGLDLLRKAFQRGAHNGSRVAFHHSGAEVLVDAQACQ
eukprot:11819810-Prorocentrum_lima.AAC.1